LFSRAAQAWFRGLEQKQITLSQEIRVASNGGKTKVFRNIAPRATRADELVMQERAFVT
jgi:hypothetical protein